MNEIWKQIKDFPNYEVSNFGQVRSLKNRYGWRDRPKILKGMLVKGYLRVFLYRNIKGYPKRINCLVAEAFLGSCPEGKEVNHKDGNKTNNHVDNLEYVTSSENKKHSFRLGLQVPLRGEKCSWSKLTEKQVKEIRRLYATGEYSQTKLGEIYDVSQPLIGGIVNHKSWKMC